MTAIIDLYSCYIVGWSLSNNMTSRWCADMYNETIAEYGTPEIINTDQGAQYTSKEFSQTIIDSGVKLSMDGKGRATDNTLIERLWRSVKFEHGILNSQKVA